MSFVFISHKCPKTDKKNAPNMPLCMYFVWEKYKIVFGTFIMKHPVCNLIFYRQYCPEIKVMQ